MRLAARAGISIVLSLALTTGCLDGNFLGVVPPPPSPGGSGSETPPAQQSWRSTGPLRTARSSHAAALLPSGLVIVAGGDNPNDPSLPRSLSSSELYDPATGTWTSTGSISLAVARSFHTATLLPSGEVLVAGGNDAKGGTLDTVEIYTP